jgi:hypothetical protein
MIEMLGYKLGKTKQELLNIIVAIWFKIIKAAKMIILLQFMKDNFNVLIPNLIFCDSNFYEFPLVVLLYRLVSITGWGLIH